MRCCNSSLQGKLFVMFFGEYLAMLSLLKRKELGVTAPLGFFDPIGIAPKDKAGWVRRGQLVGHGMKSRIGMTTYNHLGRQSVTLFSEQANGASRFNARPKGGAIGTTGFKSCLHCLTRPWVLTDDWKYLAKGSQIKRSDCKFIHLMLDRSMCMDCECVVWRSLQQNPKDESYKK